MNPNGLIIESEETRSYHYANGAEFVIPNPVKVFIIEKMNGTTHRVVSANGRTYRPERGWIGISWLPKAGEPAYVA